MWSEKIIDGKKISDKIKSNIKEILMKRLAENGGLAPVLAVILVGDDPASEVYVSQKRKACAETGMESRLIRLPRECTQIDLTREIEALNHDREVHGILLQLPLPRQLNRGVCLAAITPSKDVDGLSPYSQGLVQMNHPGLYPCTPLGIMRILRDLISLRGASATVVGYGILTGAPLTSMLVRSGVTVTVCNEFSRNPEQICSRSDIVIAAAGVCGLIQKNWIREGSIVIDVGIHRNSKGLCGDVDFQDVAEKAAWITPVPGGVGPVTVAMLLENCLKAWTLQRKIAF